MWSSGSFQSPPPTFLYGRRSTHRKFARLIDADRDLFVVEMKVINLRDWDLFWVSHSKRNTDKLEYMGEGRS